MAGTVPELARATAPGGEQLHFVDMRDHFFKHPFEMLCHSEWVWRAVPQSRQQPQPAPRLGLRAHLPGELSAGHGRAARRLTPPAFRAARPRIRPEFLTGNDERDAVTRIFVRASVD